jgi:excisionase family DNA binding protein
MSEHPNTGSQGEASVGLALLVTVEEAAQLLRLGRTRTYQLVMAGQIRSVKLGRRRLVVRSGLEDFVGQLENKGVAEDN